MAALLENRYAALGSWDAEYIENIAGFIARYTDVQANKQAYFTGSEQSR